MKKHYLLVSDFDQTLSVHDSGIVLAERLGITGFREKVAGLSRQNLVQQGAELTYLLRHDPDFRRIRREDMIEAGHHVRLKNRVDVLARLLDSGVPDHHFSFYVVSAAPVEVVLSALDGIVPPENIIGTRYGYDETTGEVSSILRGTAGYGKVAAVEEVRQRLGMPRDRVIYVGDGSSDIHVMLHVNQGEGFTIAASESRDIAQIAKRTVMSDDALSVLVPILEDLLGYSSLQIRTFFEDHGIMIQEWDRIRTDWLTFRESSVPELRALPVDIEPQAAAG